MPIAITAAGPEQVAAAGVTSTNQLNVLVPGVNIRTTVGSFQPTIRGVGTSANNVENPVALYIDDVYYPFQREGGRDLNDLAQIAVLKGPQGTLFGRNATGGVLQITTRRPEHAFSGNLRVGIDNYATLRSDIFVTGGLSEAVAGSLSGSFATQGNGWGHNRTLDRDTFKIHENWSVRGKLLVEPDALTELVLIGDYQRRNEDFAPYNRPYPGTTLVIRGAIPTGSVYDSLANIDGNLRLNAGGVSLKAKRDLGFADAISISAFRKAHAKAQWDADGTAAQAQNNVPENRTRMISQEIQIVSPSKTEFHWTAGMFYLNYRNGVDPFSRFFFGQLAPLPTSNARTVINDRETAESIALFGQADFPIFSSTRLTLGGRWTEEKRSFTGTTMSIRNNGASTQISQASSQTVRRPTWRMSLDHRFTDNFLGYLSYNRGFKSGGYNVTQPTAPAYDPERLDAYEAGFKSELLDRRVRLNAAAFYYRYHDLQLAKVVAGALTISNAASAEIYGAEADVEARITPEFRLVGGLSLVHTAYTQYPNAQIVSPNPTGGITVASGDATGNRLQLAQKVSGSITATYKHTSRLGVFEVSVTESYNGDYYFDPDNFARQPAYNMINGSVAWTDSAARVTATLFVRNLLDKKIIGQVSSAANIGLVVTYPYEPRVFGANVRYSF
ncbi:MAG TPA: TonB-dependent receptor [Sphingobium sp.]